MASSGWMRITSSLEFMSEEAPSCFLYRFPGAWWNCTRISASRLCSALPALIRKGTPSQRALSTKSAIAANVGHREPGGTVSSSRYPGSLFAPLYCPSTTLAMSIGRMERITFTFSSRMSSASKLAGSSMANNAITCSRWF